MAVSISRLLATAFVLAFCLQFETGCQQSSLFSQYPVSGSGSGAATAGGGGSGVGFEGRIANLYIHVNPLETCADLLPNDELSLTVDGRANLVRSQCATLATPQPIAMASLTFASDGSGTVTFQGVAFTPQTSPPSPSPSPFLVPGAPAISSWPASAGSSISPNMASSPAPDGSSTASALIETATTGPHFVGFTVPSYQPGTWARLYVHVKAAAKTAVFLQVQDNTAYTDSLWAAFDLTTGSVVSGQVSPGTSFAVVPEGNGWLRLGISGIPTKQYNKLDAQFGTGDVVNSVFNASTAGDGTAGIYFWGAQFEVE